MKLITKLVLFVILMTVMAGNVYAAPGINRKINFQGKVVNAGVGSTDGTNVTDSNYNFTFSLWTTLSAGTSIWSEVWNSGTSQVSVVSGIFQVSLGTHSTFPSTVNFNSDSLYVSVNFNGDGDMTPRIQMSAVPYAFNAEKVGGLTVTSTDATLSIGNSKTITFGDNFTTLAGVGITLNQNLSMGSTVVFAGLSVGGTVSFTNIAIGAGTTILYIDSNGNLVQGTLPAGGTTYTATNGLNLSGSVFGLGGTLTGNTQIGTSSFGLSFLGLGGTQGLFISKSGAIGIGRTFSENAAMGLYTNYLQVQNIGSTYNGLYFGNAAINTTDEVGIYEVSGDGVMFSYSESTQVLYYGTNGMTINGLNSMNVGIGATNAFSSKFMVDGNVSIGSAFSGTTAPANGLIVQGNVGIGTTAPSEKLEVAGNFAISWPAAPNLYNLKMQPFYTGTPNQISYKFMVYSGAVYGTSNPLSLAYNGFVGIGTSSPVKTLDVAGDINLTGTIFTAGSTGSSGQVLSSTGTGLQWITPGGATYFANNGLTMTGTTVGLGGTLSSTTKIDMNNNNFNFFGLGNLGIGTTDSLYKLHVMGDGMFSSKLGIGSTGTKSFNVAADASIGTNLSVGGSFSLTGIASGVGSSVLYIASDGNITSGTLPPTGASVHSKVIVLSPEFPGASLSADGSGTTAVSMTSDNTLNSGGVGWKNYYEVTSTNATLQDYSVIVRVTLPSDFSSWETGSCPGSTCALEFNYQTGLGATADNAISYVISNDSDTPATAVCTIGNTASTSWGSSGCAESVLNDGVAPQWNSAGEVAVIRIKMAAKNTSSALSRVGDVILRYISAY